MQLAKFSFSGCFELLRSHVRSNEAEWHIQDAAESFNTSMRSRNETEEAGRLRVASLFQGWFCKMKFLRA